MTPAQVIEEVFKIDRNDPNVSETDISVAIGEGLQTIWEYTVPTGISLVFKREHTLSVYLENASSAEAADGSQVDAVVMDSPRQTVRSILNEVRYVTLQEFQDENKRRHLDVSQGEVIAREGERVAIRGNILTAVLDASDSFFELRCTRIRHTVF